ncbi:hypothetical protein KI123_002772 [Enterococcus faecalis]|nr:hypothetical protein [Enterococcus faecalis]
MALVQAILTLAVIALFFILFYCVSSLYHEQRKKLFYLCYCGLLLGLMGAVVYLSFRFS